VVSGAPSVGAHRGTEERDHQDPGSPRRGPIARRPSWEPLKPSPRQRPKLPVWGAARRGLAPAVESSALRQVSRLDPAPAASSDRHRRARADRRASRMPCGWGAGRRAGAAEAATRCVGGRMRRAGAPAGRLPAIPSGTRGGCQSGRSAGRPRSRSEVWLFLGLIQPSLSGWSASRTAGPGYPAFSPVNRLTITKPSLR
jgi:hypothetical protein